MDPNPTCKNVHDGLATLQENDCDIIISVGGGSPQDATRGVRWTARKILETFERKG